MSGLDKTQKDFSPPKNECIEYMVCLHITEDSRNGGVIKSKTKTEVNN